MIVRSETGIVTETWGLPARRYVSGRFSVDFGVIPAIDRIGPHRLSLDHDMSIHVGDADVSELLKQPQRSGIALPSSLKFGIGSGGTSVNAVRIPLITSPRISIQSRPRTFWPIKTSESVSLVFVPQN